MHRINILPVSDSASYPSEVPSDHEIWLSLPSQVRAAAMELISQIETKLAAAPKESEDEKLFHDQIRSALLVALGVLAEAETIPKAFMITRKEGNA